jgi:hypothetical protein
LPVPTSPLAGFISIGEGDDVVWSPDSQHVALYGPDDVRIFSAQGDPVAQYVGADDVAWLDSSRLVVRDLDGSPITGAPSSDQPAPMYVVTVGASDFHLIGNGDGYMLSDGAGKLAVTGVGTPDGFEVWDGSAWSASALGYPVEWSARGDELAVIHESNTGVGVEGTAAVVSWPGLQTFAAGSGITSSDSIHLDPTGAYLGYTLAKSAQVLNIATGKLTTLDARDTSDWFGWDSQHHMVVAARNGQSVASYSVDGALVHDWGPLGDSVTSTADGTVLLFFTNVYGDQRPPAYAVIGGVTSSIPLSGASGRPPQLAPDGHALTVSAYTDTGEMFLVGDTAQ